MATAPRRGNEDALRCVKIERLLAFALQLLLPGCVMTSQPADSAKVGDGISRSGMSLAHDGSEIYYEVHGVGKPFLLIGPNSLTVRAPEGSDETVVAGIEAVKQLWIDAFKEDYTLILVDYPGSEPKLYTMTPAAVVRDFLAVADAVGADEFAYYGFSWGAVVGLQIAIRSNRMAAFVAGGFPMMDGPYDGMLKISTTLNGEAGTLYDMPVDAQGDFRPAITFYEALQRFDDRSVQGKLNMPRLNWVGEEDRATLNGELVADLYQQISSNQEDLEEAGWQVQFVPGKSHLDAAAPDTAAPLVKTWLDENWPRV